MKRYMITEFYNFMLNSDKVKKLLIFFVFIFACSVSASARKITLTQDADGTYYVNMPKTGTDTLMLDGTITSFKVYDNGGKNGNYANKANGNLILNVPKPYVITLVGSVVTSGGDGVTINDEVSSSDFLCGNFRITPFTSHDNSVTLNFKSTDYNDDKGIELVAYLSTLGTKHDITVTNPSIGGHVDANTYSACVRDTITLTAIPDDGYLIDKIVVTDSIGQIVPISSTCYWYEDINTVKFLMPAFAVNVVPTFVSITNLEVCIPKTGTTTTSIPKGIMTFKVYDNGGKNGNYANKANGNLILNVPKPYIITLVGNVVTSGGDGVTISDEVSSSDFLCGNFRITPFTSHDNSVTLNFKSTDYNDNKGIELVAYLSTLGTKHDITVTNPSTGGHVDANTYSACVRDTITLTVHPDDGFLLDSIVVTDSIGQIVPISSYCHWYYDVNTVKFVMPAFAVNVVPTFVSKDEIYVEVPRTATRTVSIPKGVTSFRVRNERRNNGAYYSDAKGSLVLNVPEGYFITLSDTISMNDNGDKFSIQDGVVNRTNIGGKQRIQPYTSHGNSATIVFSSNDSGASWGLDLLASLTDPLIRHAVIVNNPSGGVIEASSYSACVHDTITLTAHPADGYLIDNIVVTDSLGKIVPISSTCKWYEDINTVKFVMPAFAVNVTPVFLSVDNLSIEIPFSGTLKARIPKVVKSFSIAPCRAAFGHCETPNGFVEMNTSKGFIFTLTGDNMLSASSLSIKDNISNETKVYGGKAPIQWFTTCDSIATVRFWKGQYADPTGNMHLRMYLSTPGTRHAVNIINPANGGIAVADAKTACYKDTVTITAKPAEGYLLDNIIVTDSVGYNIPIKTTCRWWEDRNTVSFVMPTFAVNVVPVFVSKDSLSIEVPSTGLRTAIVPVGVTYVNVYNERDAKGKYIGTADGSLEFKGPKNEIVKVTGNIVTEENYDYLVIGDNTKSSSEQLNGTKTIPTYVSHGNYASLYFKSEGSKTFTGLNLRAKFFDPTIEHDILINNPAKGGCVEADKKAAPYNDSITLTAKPEDGYLLDNIVVTDSENNIIDISSSCRWWDDVNTVKFAMPENAVNIVPTFVSMDSLYLEIPRTGSKEFTIPAYVENFKVYNERGTDGKYYNNANGSIALHAPDGCFMRFTGNVVTEGASWDYLIITEDSILSSGKLGGTSVIPTFHTNGQNSTMSFKSDNGSNKTGINVSVRVINRDLLRDVTVKSVNGGVITSDKKKARYNDVVKLTSKPNEDYFLDKIVVTDSEKNNIEISSTCRWYEYVDSVTFTMPYNAVEVVATFVHKDSLCVEIPRTGLLKVAYPEDVTSIKVHNETDANGVYYKKANGTLILEAPERYAVTLNGNIVTESGPDYLSVQEDGKALHANYSANMDISSCSSFYNSMTLFFHSDGSKEYSGIDADASLEEVGLRFKVPASGVGTYSATVPFTVPEGLEAYYCKVYDDSLSRVSVVTIEGVIPANTGVVLVGKANETYQLTESEKTPAAFSDNLLVGVPMHKHVETTAIIEGKEYTNYMMKNGKFVKIAEATDDKIMPSHRAYLKIKGSEPSLAREISLLWDELVTGINKKVTTYSNDVNAPIYNLSGQRVQHPTNGIYIVNGKKVVIKNNRK